MRRRARSFLGYVLFSAGSITVCLWRSKRCREYARLLLAPASDCVRDFLRRAFGHQADTERSDDGPQQHVTGLAAPEARPLTSPAALLSWRPESAAQLDPDAPLCRTYNAPLLLPLLTGTNPLYVPNSGGSADLTSPSSNAGSADSGADGGGDHGSGGGGGRPGCRPRLLVCHDMLGGYLQDRLVQGGPDPGCFRLWQWDTVDVFVYFSHHLVTLPPPGWIAAAHRNGVRVLGTFITEEWARGRGVCEQLFASPAAARDTADALVRLAAYYGFEGWLVNVENGLSRGSVPHLAHFLAHLRARLAAAVGPAAMVVWYDALTTDGRLAWQDGLTPRNSPFMDAADALFVNYTWKQGAPAAVAAAAGSRAADVYMGVDVFGRGSYGGGKDNCPFALSAARSAGLSAALFAPGWVYEEFERSGYEARQERFWDAIHAVWPPRPAPLRSLPLVTCFNGGAGRATWLGGRRVSAAPWCNLAAQDATPRVSPQEPPAAPAAAPAAAPPPATLRVRPTQQLAFSGGSCLELTLPDASSGAAAGGGRFAAHTLYDVHLPAPAAGLDVSFIAACVGGSRLALLLRTAPPPSAAAAAGAAAAGSAAAAAGQRCGLAVGPWTSGDRAVVEALTREGYTCVACQVSPTGAATCPLPDPPASGSGAAATAAAASPTPSAVPADIHWVSYEAHLPYSMIAAASGGACVVSSVGILGYTSSSGSGGGGAVTTSAPPPASSGGKASARSSATGAAPTPAASAAAASSGSGAAQAFRAFLGRLVLREHRHMGLATSPPPAVAAPPATTSLPGVLVAAPLAPPPPLAPLTGVRCSRVVWSRPGDDASSATASSSGGGSRPRSSASRAAPGGGVAAAMAAAVAAISGGADGGSRAQSGELIGSHSDDDWERSSGGSASAPGGGVGGIGVRGVGRSPGMDSPVMLGRPAELIMESEEDDDDVGLVGSGAVGVASAASGSGGAAATGGQRGDDPEEGPSAPWLLTCDLSWEPAFDEWGLPRHRSYHVWAHFGGSGGNGGEAVASAKAEGGSHELLPPAWRGAVWAGEAFVGGYRLVQLEVPAGAAEVLLLLQGTGWQDGEAGQCQLAAQVALPPPPPGV